MIFRDPYVWIDPWAEFERFERECAAMSDERNALLFQYSTLFQRIMEPSGLYTQPIISVVVPK